MPIYEYKCTDCGEKFEVTQGLFQQVKPKCPRCKSEKARRIYSAASRITSCEPPPRTSSGFG